MSTIYDHDGSMLRMGNDEALFREMVGLLKTDAPQWFGALSTAHAERDMAKLQRAAHTLKGLAANFGASRAVNAAAEMERLAKLRQTAGMDSALSELKESLDELIAALASPLATSPSS